MDINVYFNVALAYPPMKRGCDNTAGFGILVITQILVQEWKTIIWHVCIKDCNFGCPTYFCIFLSMEDNTLSTCFYSASIPSYSIHTGPFSVAVSWTGLQYPLAHSACKTTEQY